MRVLIVLLLLLCVAPATATEDAALILARICASEASILRANDTNDCPGIFASLATKASIRGVSWTTHARSYSPRSFRLTRTDDRRYIAHLHPSGREPAGWPRVALRRTSGGMVEVEHLPWSAARRAWLDLYARAQRIVAGEEENPCDGPVVDWGDHQDARAYLGRNPDAVERTCTNTRNRFFWLTRYDERDGT